MAIILDATIGGLSSNSYLSVSRSNVLAELAPHMDDWLTDASINKPQLLIAATRMIDLDYKPRGTRANSSQRLWWPQVGLCYTNTYSTIPNSIIPEFLEWACLEYAWFLHENPDPYSQFAAGLSRLDTPSYSMDFTGNGSTPKAPEIVGKLLAPYCNRQLGPMIRLVRV